MRKRLKKVMSYDYFKALHIIFVVTWFAGLFYLPRLFIYFIEAGEKSPEEKDILQSQFKIMQRRLWYGITWPSCILTFLFGLAMLHDWFPLTDHPWLIVKLSFVFFLFLYHLSLGKIQKDLAKDVVNYSSNQMRMWNEVSTIFLVAIVFLVKLQDILHMGWGLLGLFGLILILMVAIKLYKKMRTQNG